MGSEYAEIVTVFLGKIELYRRSCFFIVMTNTINQSIDQSPESPETYFQFGDRYRNSGNIPLALKNYQKALTLNPDFAPAHEQIGLIHQEVGNTMEAIASFSRAIAIEPRSLESQLGLGNAYQQMGWFELAITHFENALTFYPDRFLAEYHCKLGNSLRDRGKTVEAIACYERAIAVNADDVQGYRAIAQIYLKQNDPEAADLIYERANAHNLEILEGKDYNLLGVAWMQKSQVIDDFLGRAIACFQKAIQVQPAYADAHCNLASTFVHQNQIRDAVIAYKEAIDIDPNFAQAYFNLGILLNNIGKTDEAIACFQSAIALVPDWVEAHQYLGIVLAKS
jgi:tetratricopeptide (TPR) repeat protein